MTTDSISQLAESSPQKFFAHSGYASKKKGPQIVDQNVIGEEKIPGTKRVEKLNGGHPGIEEMKETLQEFYLGQKHKGLRELLLSNKSEKTLRPTVSSMGLSFDTPSKSGVRSEQTIPSSSDEKHPMHRPEEQQQIKFLGKAEIRKLLYPRLKEEFLGDRTMWVIKFR